MDINQLRLGAVPLSPDILAKANIGLWAFELDEGSQPRMYVDNTMLGLIGLEHQVSPEETYHAWYDHIDEGSYDLVNDAVGKMVAGEHAEVQYPWHHPDGRTMIVRCGGVRNPKYKAGVRIEGTHQNVTEMLHFDENEVRRRHLAELQLQHEHLRSEVLSYMVDHDDDPIELLKTFAERLRVLIGCDQVIYRDLEETRIMVNSPAIEKTWSVPIEYCRQCQHFDAHHPMYAGGYTEMDNCQKGWNGIPVFHKCPIKSSLTRIVYCDGKVAGYLAIHFVVGYHKFTDLERSTLEEFTRILSISLSKYEAQKENRELKLQKALAEQETLSDGLAREYHTVWLLEGHGAHNMHLYRSTGVKTIKSAVQLGLDVHSYDTGILAYIRDYVHEDDQKRVLEQTKFETVERETPEIGTYVVSYRRYNNDHTDYDYHQMCYARAVAADGTVNYIFAYRDADKTIREQLAQKAQLEEALQMAQAANRAKTIFLNNMSHDIRTPMNAVVGFNRMALRELGKNDEKVRECLEKVKRSSNSLLNIINDILEISRIEAGKVTLNEDKGDASYSFANIESMMIQLADDAGIDLQFSYGDMEDRFVICDFVHTSRIFTNLISNAIKYSNPGGWVRVNCSQIGRRDGFAIYRYTFQDNGIGMSEEFQKELFSPFSREQNTTVSRIQGTGLGLAMCKDLVELMNGTITCVSKQGKGTTFTVTLPFKIQEGQDYVEPKTFTEVDKKDFSGKRVLLVEDNELNCEISEALLEEYGISVSFAHDGDIAVDMMKSAKKGEYDMILMDIQMPRMDGYEATRQIRALGTPISRIPIIAMTANAFEEDRKLAISAGMDSHLSKPIEVDKLYRTLAEFL